VETELTFVFAFMPVLPFEPPTILGSLGKPGRVPGAAHLLEQKR